MRPVNNTTNGWRSTTATFKRQLSNLTVFRAVLIFSLLAGLALSFTLIPNSATTAQERKPEVATQDLSLPDAESRGLIKASDLIAPVELVLSAPEGGACTWTAAPAYPVTILDQATAGTSNGLYVFAGVSTAIVASARKFDGTVWTDIAPYPVAVEFPAAVSNGTDVFIMNGIATGSIYQTALNRYNTGSNTYTALAPNTVGTWNQAAVFLNNKIYKMGGTALVGAAAAATNVVEIYDVATNTWTLGAPLPLATSFPAAFTNGGFVYVAGGLQGTPAAGSAKTYRYDPATNTWDDAAIADLPATRWGAAAAFFSGGGVLAGGYVGGDATANISTSVIEWNPSSNTWTPLPSMLAERSRMSGAVYNNGFHVIGGRSIASAAFVGTNNNQRLTCASNIAVPVPGSVNIASESCGTPNGVPDPGETLTVTLPFSNVGDIPTTNLTVTLQATGGVVAANTQTYGAIPPGGAATTRTFTFQVAPGTVCGSNVTLTFTVSDGATNYANVTRVYTTGIRSTVFSENFDGVTAPALPAGWTNTQISGTEINWVTSTTTPSSAPNAAFANDPATVNLSALTSPAVAITAPDAQISFKNKFITETNFDGTVLEYSTNNGTTWTDVITGGGTFVSGGYTGTLSTGFANPLPGRMAWTGTSPGSAYIDTVVNLPASLNGQSVRFRWLMGSDNAVAATGSWVDDVKVLGARVCNTNCTTSVCNFQKKFDYDGDGKADVSVYRPAATGVWYLLNSGSAAASTAFGATGDVIVPADYDGDGKTDIAVYRGGTWFLQRSTAGFTGVNFGSGTDIPEPADIDGDGKSELVVFRPSNGVWYTYNLTGGATTSTAFGQSGDRPVVGDYDGDCKGDLAVFRPSNGTWYIARSSGGFTGVAFGQSGDLTVPADYDGDGKTDVAVFRSGVWYILRSTAGFSGVTFGFGTDLPVPADYDGDNKADLAVFRPSVGNWFIQRTTAGFTGVTFGASSDVPTPYAYVP